MLQIGRGCAEQHPGNLRGAGAEPAHSCIRLIASVGRVWADADSCYEPGVFAVLEERIASLTLPPMALRAQCRARQIGATRSTARVCGAPLFVLILRLLVFLLPEPGERKGRGGWARPAAPRPCSRGPEVPRPHLALWSLVGCGAGLAVVGERGTSSNAPLDASGRGRLGSARRCVPGELSTGVPGVRPHPLSRQSRGLSAIHRFSGSAMPFLLPPSCPNRGGETPVSPGRNIWSAGLLQPGVSSPLARCHRLLPDSGKPAHCTRLFERT